LATIAPIAPGTVEFQIHHVVPAFQINMAKYEKRKNLSREDSLSARSINGIHATKINIVKGETGHANSSNRPDITLRIKEEYLFKYYF
jgi:transposase